MENHRTGRNPLSLIVPAASGVAAVLAAGVLGGLWLRPAEGSAWPALLTAAALAAAAILGVVWLSRARAARRLNAALDAYAEREIARGKARTYPPRGGVFQTHRASPTGPPRR
jgi:hypothetical protein